MPTFNLAMIQMNVVGGDVPGNISHAAQLIEEAARSGAQVALLPECMDVGWTHPRSRELADEIPDGRTYQTLGAAAVANNIFVCAGITERCGDLVFNSAVLIDPNGKLLLVHRKLNELDIAFDCYDQGDRLGVAHTKLGTIGVMTCADACAKDNVICTALGYMGADVILSPCAWAVPPGFDHSVTPYGAMWREVYQPIARDFSMPIIGVSNIGDVSGGPWNGHRCIGCSLVVDGSGQVVATGPFDLESTLYLDIETIPRPARGGSWWAQWNNSHQV